MTTATLDRPAVSDPFAELMRQARPFRPAPPPSRVQPVSPVKPVPVVVPDSTIALVPRDLVVRVGRLAGFAIYYSAGHPFYKERTPLPGGQVRETEVEFVLPHIAFRIMSRAPHLSLVREAAHYVCTLKTGQVPQRAPTLIEAVFRAFTDAKAPPKAA